MMTMFGAHEMCHYLAHAQATSRKGLLDVVKQEWNKVTYDTIRTKWMYTEPEILVYDTADKNITAAVDTFMQTLESFKADLIKDNQKHLLFIQPHLSIRNIHRIDSIEMAVFNLKTSSESLNLKVLSTNDYKFSINSLNT